MLKRGVTVWNYPGDEIENGRIFHSLGFDAISWLGSRFVAMEEDAAEAVAAFLRETGMTFTVHYALPDPEVPDKCREFERGIAFMRAWQQRHGLMAGLTFDVWYDLRQTLPYLAHALDVFRGLGAFLACEDTPLNRRAMEQYAKILKPGDDYGILVDTGHLNIRQYTLEMHEPEDFVEIFEKLPLPVRELHLHDNKGRKDDHRQYGFGNLPLDGVVEGLRRIGFGGIVSVEIVQQDWSRAQGFEYAVQTRDAFFSRWDAPRR
ncbi:MAG TPA: TIM barrel protein [Clostridia bacterium]|nr:TIM barrel protein [Clostridia bacterium]